MLLASLVSPQMTAWGVSDGRIISFWNFIINFPHKKKRGYLREQLMIAAYFLCFLDPRNIAIVDNVRR